MRNLRKFWIIAAIGAVITFGMVLGLAGCATSVPISSVRQPTIPTGDIQRLAIAGFTDGSGFGGTVSAQLPRHMTQRATEIITGAGKFTIVAANDPNAEGVFSGMITNITSRDSQSQREVRNQDGTTRIVTTYRRDVTLAFTYEIKSSRTNMTIGSVTKRGETSSSAERPDSLADTLSLAQRIADSQMRSLQQDVVPTIVQQNVRLMRETSKDKVVKQKMKDAQTLVKHRNYEEAIRLYDAIASEHSSVAARNNSDLLRRTISSDIAAREQMAELYIDTGGLTGRAVTSAISSINSKLSPGASLMIIQSSSAERSQIDFVVNEITRNIVQAGNLRVVEFTNRDLLVAEADYQLSGNVSDNLSVSIGRQHGAQYIVLCSIIGDMSGRQLNVKILEIETALVIEQISLDI
ncbi:MAG: penicillin-binding protein activator LpoB [Treponema sp.]|nr:penicillin-binding protein activator LpoB [Treponema sp.]